MLNEIIKRIRNLTHEQQKEIMEYLEFMQQDGQRGYSRLSTELKIDAVVDNDKLILSNTRDISASGVYINTRGIKFENDKNVRVVFSIPRHDTPFKLHGEIIRIDKDGIAIRFDKVNPYFVKTLDGAIWKDEDR